MPLSVAKHGIDFIVRNARLKNEPSIEITYHGGGEPSVHWDVMTASFDYARSAASTAGLRVAGYTATNGVLRKEQMEWMVSNLSGASVSFDGLPSAQDSNRFTVLGQSSSSQVEATLRRFDAVGFSYGIRMTVTDDHIADLPKAVEYVVSRFRPVRIQIEPAYRLGRGADGPPARASAFVDAFRAARAMARGYGVSLFFSAARLDVLSNHFCATTRDSFALSPRGGVSGCYEVFSEEDPAAPVFFYGAAEESGGFRFDLDRLAYLRSQTVEHREYCSGCFAKWHCAGDCLHKAVAAGSAEFEGSERCHITRELIKDEIVDRITASGGLVWSGAGVSAGGGL
jgi:uncharacterized protein